jgi:hypothetical protein
MEDRNYITYLFGAGASAQAIPVASQLRDRLIDLKDYLQNNYISVNHGTLSSFHPDIRNYQVELQMLIGDIDWLINESKEYQTIDVFAKQLYDNESTLLSKLKMVLTFYFYFEQIISIPTKNNSTDPLRFQKINDPRYDTLISQIAKKDSGNIILNSKIKILTWNYDMQIDLAIKKHTYKDISTVKKEYNIYPNLNTYNNSEKFNINVDEFCAVKLNGNAYLDNLGYENDGLSQRLYDENNDNNVQAKIAKALLVYVLKFSKRKNFNIDQFKFFNFSWEEDGKYTGFDNTFGYVKKIANQTKILVVCGYSFPPFNSYFDMQILNEMWPTEIHIQDENPQVIEERIRDLNPRFDSDGDKDYPKIRFKHISKDGHFSFPSLYYYS